MQELLRRQLQKDEMKFKIRRKAGGYQLII